MKSGLWFFPCVALSGLALLPLGSGRTAAAAEPPVDFSRDIQPLLAKRCAACHGPDTQEGGLRLDDRRAAVVKLDSGGQAIVPGKPADSLILERITATDPDIRMPPEGPRLTAAQVAAIKTWIEQGAEWKEHWAFQPVSRPAVPAAGHPIDAFVKAEVSRRGLSSSPPAAKAVLLRRATYSVTGLPPSEQEMLDFLADEAPNAWEKVVDRLLASPHYGEAWARHWLDVVRYADTNSFERDGAKPSSWRYRDYVIRSLNDDKPYDRFVVEQLAGDELPDPTGEALIATGYYRLGLWDDEPADRVQAKYDGFDDIVATTGQAFLGLTINCSRCHDHKIDPLPQKDYYALLAFFHNITPNGYGPNVERPIFADAAAERDYQAKVADLERRRNEAQRDVSSIEARVRKLLEAEKQAVATAGSDLDELQFRFYRDTWERLPAFDELKPEDTGAVPGNLFDIGVAPSLRPDSFGYVFTGFLKVPETGDYSFTLDSDDGSRLIIGGTKVVEHDGVHGEGNPQRATVRLEAGRQPIRLEYFQGLFGKGLDVGWQGPGFAAPRRLSAAPAAPADGRDRGRKIADVIKADGERLLGAAGKRDYDEAVKRLEKLKREQVPVDKAMVVSEQGPKPPETHVFYRGNPHAETSPATLVQPAFPAILKPPAAEITPPAGGRTSGRRTALAAWIASAANPLTSRVIVNRIWQHHFGRGIVRSPNNFGMAGDPPTHPQLLDWLAAELVAGNWRLKRIHKLILMSEAYRASSAADQAALVKDPLNDSLWRFDMRRLTAEELRDSIHVASGVFNPAMYGPGVYPEIPAEVMAGQSRPGAGWGKSSPEEQARRSVYIHVKRSLLTPILADFDLADTDSSCPVRFTTTQPTQALGMMNGGFLHAQSRLFADRVRREAGGPDAANVPAMVRRALEIALVRTPSDAEVAKGVAVIDALEDKDGVGPGRALELYCLMVLNLNEFAYLD
jgi:mono/diheme cytochrome c family protein